MSEQVIARRYARALLNLAVKENQAEEIAQDIAGLAEALSQQPRFMALFAQPKIPSSHKERTITQLAERLELPATLRHFLRLLAQKRRLPLLGTIAGLYGELNDARQNRARATAVSAKPLSPAQTKVLHATLEQLLQQRVVLSVRSDAGLLGGLVVQAGSRVWDASIQGKLKRLRQSLLE